MKLTLVLLAGFIVSACSSNDLRTAPSEMESPQPSRSPMPWIVSGTVYESVGHERRPMADARVDVSAAAGGGMTTTGADGRYAISGLTAYNTTNEKISIMGVIARKAGYSQLCRPTIAEWRDGVVTGADIYLVADVNLSSTGTPSSLPVLPSMLTGVVLEQTPTGSRPVAGARVIADFGWGMNLTGQLATFSDEAGRYLLCGFAEPYHPHWDEGATDYPIGRTRLIVTRAGSARVDLDVDVSTDRRLDVELSAR